MIFNKPLELKPGTLIDDRYEIEEFIAEGSMGEVFIVQNLDQLGTKCVLKVLRSEFAKSKSFLKRFRNEMIAGLVVSHRNVAKTYEFIQKRRFAAYTMEFVEGEELRASMDEVGCFDVKTVIDYMDQIARGTRALHINEIIHRDLKPDNIIINQQGVLKITDFGISILDINARTSEAGAILGSMAYVAPEYIMDDQVTFQSDIYAIGIIAYELLTGDLPFLGEDPMEQIENKVQRPPLPISYYRKDVPALVSDFIMKMIARDPNYRFQSCNEIINKISHFKDMSEKEMEEFYEANKEEFLQYDSEAIRLTPEDEEELSSIIIDYVQPKKKEPEKELDLSLDSIGLEQKEETQETETQEEEPLPSLSIEISAVKRDYEKEDLSEEQIDSEELPSLKLEQPEHKAVPYSNRDSIIDLHKRISSLTSGGVRRSLGQRISAGFNVMLQGIRDEEDYEEADVPWQVYIMILVVVTFFVGLVYLM